MGLNHLLHLQEDGNVSCFNRYHLGKIHRSHCTQVHSSKPGDVGPIWSLKVRQTGRKMDFEKFQQGADVGERRLDGALSVWRPGKWLDAQSPIMGQYRFSPNISRPLVEALTAARPRSLSVSASLNQFEVMYETTTIQNMVVSLERNCIIHRSSMIYFIF